MGGGTMCGVVFGNQPSVCSEHVLRICITYVFKLRHHIRNVHPGARE